MERLTDGALIRPFWAVEIEADSLANFDASCAERGITREQGVREACMWLCARSAVWVERARQREIAELFAHADSWDPLGDFLSGLRQPARSERSEGQDGATAR